IQDPIHGSGKRGTPIRVANTGFGFSGCGWVFHQEDRFDQEKILRVLQMPWPQDEGGNWSTTGRVKGFFPSTQGWVSVNGLGPDQRLKIGRPGADGRLEVIVAGTAPDWPALETKLLECLI
nr:GTP-binding protein [Fibrobacterota bacterium]